jgi:mannose-6-phosphate isomerase-like protein (cupin superfamily)
LKGKINLKIESETISLCEGDSIFFDGRLSHVPENPGRGEAMFLVIYLIKQNEG